MIARRPFFLSRPAVLLLAAFAATAQASDLSLQAPDDISDLLTPWLPEDAVTPARLQGQLSEILATEGYFNPQFDFSEEGETLRLKLDPGPRTQVTEVDVTVDGKIDEKSRKALIDGWLLPVGKPFRQDDWNAAKQQLLAELLAVEHADAQLLDSEADINAETNRATLHAHYDAGPRYRFGKLRVEGLQRYTPDLIDRYNRIVDYGDPYREDSLVSLQSTLQSTPYFSSVQTVLDREDAELQDDGTQIVPVLVRVRERSPHRLSFGVGASSNTGARVESNFHSADLFGQARELDTGLRLEQKRQTLYTDVFLPPDDRHHRDSVGGMVEATDIQGLKTERKALGVQRVQQRGSVEQRLSLNWENEHRRPQDADAVTSRALVPNVMWTWRHIDNPLDPHEGIVIQGQVGVATRAALSDQNFVRLHTRVQYYLPVGKRDTITLRGEVGSTFADSRQHIPQDYLFRAGGAGSVRGYTYHSLGIKEGSAVVGGRYLAIASAEFTHWLSSDWGLATFIDAGDAVDQVADLKPALGYGLGARWRSPAGPIGVDLAYGQRSHSVQLHFSLAIPF